MSPSSPLNDKAVQALVQFFLDADKQSRTFEQMIDEPVIYLAVALNIELGSDGDTLEIAIRHALTRKDQ